MSIKRNKHCKNHSKTSFSFKSWYKYTCMYEQSYVCDIWNDAEFQSGLVKHDGTLNQDQSQNVKFDDTYKWFNAQRQAFFSNVVNKVIWWNTIHRYLTIWMKHINLRNQQCTCNEAFYVSTLHFAMLSGRLHQLWPWFCCFL